MGTWAGNWSESGQVYRITLIDVPAYLASIPEGLGVRCLPDNGITLPDGSSEACSAAGDAAAQDVTGDFGRTPPLLLTASAADTDNLDAVFGNGDTHRRL